MNLHITKVITIVGTFLVAFVVVGTVTKFSNVDISWQGDSQLQEPFSNTSKKEQSTIYPTTILKQDNYSQGSIKPSVSEKIYVKPTLAPINRTQTVYIGYFSLTTQCLIEGVDAVKTADSVMLDSFYDTKSCIEDRKKDANDCFVGCDTVFSKSTNLCVTDYQSLGYVTFNDCGNGEGLKQINCREKCTDLGKREMEDCAALSRERQASLKSLVSAYCNK